ncbi:MAG: mandelate racemase/muconate lactonizing enzyme family protein [Gammaproteobacteria bacterium]|nr:mandelate racemase/muconate lactonizing enzyme family protein [Gammaproteobacteria bacterium]
MKITSVTVYRVPLTARETYYMSDGKTCATVDTAVVRVSTDAGITGWGEVCPIPHYLPAFARGVAPVIAELEPVLIAADPRGAEALIAACDAYLMDHRYAKSALDIAFWDITAKAADMPLYRLLGGKRADSVPTYHSITCTDPERMAEIAKAAKADGITQFQVKVGADADWAMDVARIRAVREAVGGGYVVYADWNSGATVYDAIRVGHAVRGLDIMLEQPCETLDAIADVRRNTNLPMKIDEAAHDIESLLRAQELGCMDVVALKLSKFGGLSALRRARDLCTHFGTMMVIEDTWGSDIATAAAVHLGVTVNPKLLLNVCDLSGYVTPHLADDGPSRMNGRLAVGDAPGLGITVEEDRLGEPELSIGS